MRRMRLPFRIFSIRPRVIRRAPIRRGCGLPQVHDRVLGNVIAQYQDLRVVAPQLIAQAVLQAHPLSGKFLGAAR